MNTLDITPALIEDFALDTCEVNISIHENYSGRGMYGRPCLGISGDEEELMAFITGLAHHVGFALGKGFHNKDDDMLTELYEETTQGSRYSDSLGHGLVWYWPDVQINQEVA